MKPRKALNRVSMKQGKQLAARKPIPQQSRRTRADQPRRRKVRAAVFARDGYRCVLLDLVPGHECFGELTPHHRKKASRRGGYTLANLVSVCAWGNDVWIETHHDEATALGLLVPSWQEEAS